MKLDVLASEKTWYADGLQFTCSQCGNCCTGGPGYVWISKEEIARLAEHLKITPDETIEKYCRKIGSQFSLKENRNHATGEYDCIFLVEQRVGRGGDEKVVQTKRGCSIYPVRPLQCRTWPFWSGNLTSESSWNRAAKRCHGMNRGRKFNIEKIQELRDAKDWPDNPPTSAAKAR